MTPKKKDGKKKTSRKMARKPEGMKAASSKIERKKDGRGVR